MNHLLYNQIIPYCIDFMRLRRLTKLFVHTTLQTTSSAKQLRKMCNQVEIKAILDLNSPFA